MPILVIALLLLAVSLALCLGLVRVLEGVVERNAQDVPTFHDPGPIFHHQVADYLEVRSQFAWQSRSHFRAPD